MPQSEPCWYDFTVTIDWLFQKRQTALFTGVPPVLRGPASLAINACGSTEQRLTGASMFLNIPSLITLDLCHF